MVILANQISKPWIFDKGWHDFHIILKIDFFQSFKLHLITKSL